MKTDPAAAAANQAQATSARAMITTLGLVASLCGLVIVATFELTWSAAETNRKIALERAVRHVIPAAERIIHYEAGADGTLKPAGGALPPGAIGFYATYGDTGELLGIVAEGSGKGYADVVRVLFAYQPACECITGLAVVGMRETPGIGDKIITDRAFQDNFVRLDARLNTGGTALENAIVTVNHGSKKHEWQIDAIAGATITSRAVGQAVNSAAQALLPRVVPRLGEISHAPPHGNGESP